MNTEIKICKADSNCAGTIVELARKTFVETYGESGNEEDVQNYIDEKFAFSKVEQELNHEEIKFFIARADERTVGFTKIRSDRKGKNLNDKKCLEIERIYVLKEYQGFHVGKELMNTIKQIAREEGFETIWLQVWQKNTKAVQFYQKAGFVAYETTTFHYGSSFHHDYIMRLDLYY
jgi:ribosomal protein S18 acetylase RimI-like enzyme